MESVAPGSAINAASNAYLHAYPSGMFGGAMTAVPSAVSVQIMCPTAISGAAGIIYAGVMSTQAQLAARTETFDSYFNKFVNFQAPRLCSAGKVALRGLHVNSYPLNMSELSDFKQMRDTGDGAVTYTEGQPEPLGFAPILIYNPGGATLELLICTEWRVRFDLDNPASSSHRHHPASSDSMWDTLSRRAASMGHGAMDIADVVANAGQAYQAFAGVGRKLGMLAELA